jgi:hypothetical protein
MEINIDSAENQKLLETMSLEHPLMPKEILKQAIRFYRSGVIDSMAAQNNKKKRGRKPKPKEIPSEIVAVTIKSPDQYNLLPN